MFSWKNAVSLSGKNLELHIQNQPYNGIRDVKVLFFSVADLLCEYTICPK